LRNRRQGAALRGFAQAARLDLDAKSLHPRNQSGWPNAKQFRRAIGAEEFLILPHPEVLQYMRNKTDDYGRWIGGMRKLNRRFRG